MCFKIKDFEDFVQEAARCVRPGEHVPQNALHSFCSALLTSIAGGILLMTEGNLEVHNEYGQPQEIAFGEGEPGQSWLARALFGQPPFINNHYVGLT